MLERSFSQDGPPLVVAHRGASAEADENTLAALLAGADAGAEAVEFDVRLTRDGVPIVLHDAAVDRTTDGTGLARDMTVVRMKRLRTPGGHRVPTLEEALAALSGKAAVDIELKQLPGEPDHAEGGAGLVEAILGELERTRFEGPVLLSSFDPSAIARARRLAPSIPTGLLAWLDDDADEALETAADGGHQWVLPFIVRVQESPPGLGERVHRAGLRLGVWLTDDPVTSLDLMGSGVDAVATNDPRTIVAARREAFGS